MQTTTRPQLTRGVLLLLAACFALMWFGPLDYRHLLPSDEGRYAQMAREMFASADWVTLRYDGYKYFEKPPLQTWITALAYAAFGVGDWQARLWTAVSGFGGILVVGFAAARVFNPLCGLLAAVVLASAPYWNLMGHFNALDMGLAFTMTVALMALLLAQRPGLPSASVRGWMWLCWAAMGLAVLSKGLIGIVLPGTALILYTLILRDWALWRRLYLLSGLPVLLLITVPWFVLIQHRNPEFFDFFFINEHFRRFVNPDHNRTGPLYYFVPVLLVGFLPWLATVWPSLRHAFRLPRQPNGFSPVALMGVWSVFIFVFFSVSESKLVSYVLPVAPPIAILIGLYLPLMSRAQVQRLLAVSALIVVAGAFGAIFLARMGDARTPNALYREYQVWVYVALGLALLGTALAAWVERRRRAATPLPTLLIYAFGWFIAVSVAGNGHEVFGRQSSGALLAPAIQAAAARMPADTPFYSVNVLDHTLPFYLRRTMILVQHADELGFGVQQEPQKWLPSVDAWIERWNHERYGFALMKPAQYQSLLSQGVPMRVVARDERRVVVEKPAP